MKKDQWTEKQCSGKYLGQSIKRGQGWNMQNRKWEAYMGHDKVILFASDCNVIKEMRKKEKAMF